MTTEDTLKQQNMFKRPMDIDLLLDNRSRYVVLPVTVLYNVVQYKCTE